MAPPRHQLAHPKNHAFDFDFAQKTATIVLRMIHSPGIRSERACRRWALRSDRHLQEVLSTMRTIGALDALRIFASPDALTAMPPPSYASAPPPIDRAIGGDRTP
jgi:hypothetical protein